MKYCHKCGMTYDDTWKVCLRCTNPLQDHAKISTSGNEHKIPTTTGMKRCAECGAEILEKAVMCPKCGAAASRKEPNTGDQITNSNNAPDWAYFLTCCCAPIPGIILYLIWKDERPKAAKDILPWMVAGCIGFVILLLLIFAFGAIGGLIGGALGV